MQKRHASAEASSQDARLDVSAVRACLHICHLNFVCGETDFGSAVLIRALKPLSGLPITFKRRQRPQHSSPGDQTYLCNGPKNLCVALAITHGEYDGLRISDTPIRLYKASKRTSANVVCGPRFLGKTNPAKPKCWLEAALWPRSYVLANDGCQVSQSWSQGY